MNVLKLGKQGENLVTEISFADFLAECKAAYGTGTLSLVHQRSDDEGPYAVALTDGCIWQVKAADVQQAGNGIAELTYTVGDVVKKSIKYMTQTLSSLGQTVDAPAAWQSYIDRITTKVASVDNVIAAESSRVSAETARASAETARATAESSRATDETARVTAESGRATAESGRVSAETARVSAETARAAAEDVRASAETSRATAETARDTAETARAAAESVRVSAESGRVSAESSRVSAETARATAETARSGAETSRVSAETARASAETSRVNAETSRVNAETARATAEAARQTATGKVTNMTVEAQTKDAGTDATVTKGTDANGNVKLTFGIPKGEKGDTGGIDSPEYNALEECNVGNTYNRQTDSTEAYTKLVPDYGVLASISLSDKTFPWNQLSPDDTDGYSVNRATLSAENRVITLTKNTSTTNISAFGFAVTAGHAYYLKAKLDSLTDGAYVGMCTAIGNAGGARSQDMVDFDAETGVAEAIRVIPENENSYYFSLRFSVASPNGSVAVLKDIVVCDLTLIYGEDVPEDLTDERIELVKKYAAVHPAYVASGTATVSASAIEIKGANIFDPTKLKSSFAYTNNTITGSFSATNRSFFNGAPNGTALPTTDAEKAACIRLEPNTTYIVTYESNKTVSVLVYEGDSYTAKPKGVPFTIGDEVGYLNLRGVTGTYQIRNLCIKCGTNLKYFPVHDDTTYLPTDDLTNIPVESGGSITFRNTEEIAVPSTVEYRVKRNLGAEVSQQSADIADLKTGKQDKLVAGSGITIADDGKTISASGGGGSGSTAYEKVADVTISTTGENTVTLSRAIRLTDVYITIINKTGNASSITNPQISPIKSDNSAFGIIYYTGNQSRCAAHITGFPDEIVALSTYHNAGYGGISAVPNITWAMNNATDVTAFKFSQVNANTQIKIYVR